LKREYDVSQSTRPSTTKIAIVGSGGFIGRALVDALNAHHEIVALDRQTCGDFLDVGDWPARLAGCHAVIHLAARVHRLDETHQRWEDYEAANVTLTERVAQGASEAGVGCFVFLSSAAVYGGFQAPGAPAFHEDGPTAPNSIYGRSKVEGEAAVLRHADGLRPIIVRAPLVYGPGGRANILILAKAVARGVPLPLGAIANRRSFLYVGNLVDFIRHALARSGVSGVYNVTDGVDLSTPDLVRLMATACDRRARLLRLPPAILRGGLALMGRGRQADGLTRDFCLNCGRAQATGWAMPFTPAEGIAKTMAWLPH
jgi:UDP-glucose 4-epimerase